VWETARGWRWVETSRRWGRRIVDLVPLTPLGAGVGAAGVLALRIYAYPRMDLVLLVAGWVAALLPVVSAAVVVGASVAVGLLARRRSTRGGSGAVPTQAVESDGRGAPGRGAHRGMGALHLDTGRVVPTGFSLPSLWFVPLVEIDWTWENPSGSAVTLHRRFGRLEERVRAIERGRADAIVRRVVVADALGLARVAFRVRDRTAVVVSPGTGALRALPTLLSLSGGEDVPHPLGIAEGDLVDTRRYVPGDPVRLVHWKAYARARKLVVRRPERALSRARRTVAYLVAGPADDPSAGAARVALEQHTLGADWRFGADGGASEGTTRLDEALALVIDSVAARARGGDGLAPFLTRAEREGPASLVLFVPPEPGAWLDRVVGVLRGRRGARVVVGIDTVVTAPPPRWWRRLLARVAAPSGTRAEALDAVLRRLAEVRADVVVVDRMTGKVLGEGHRRAVAALGAARARAPRAAVRDDQLRRHPTTGRAA
jgi:hypothetical protein